MISFRLPPTFMVITPSSQPLITRPTPMGNSKGLPRSRELSNFVPFSSQPAYSTVTVLPGDGLSPVPTTSSTYFKPVSVVISWPDCGQYCQRIAPMIATAMQRVTIGQRFDFLGG